MSRKDRFREEELRRHYVELQEKRHVDEVMRCLQSTFAQAPVA
jgi:hypothetical protein